MGAVVVVMGIPGSGKTSVLDGALAKVKGARKINYADVMISISSKKGINDRDILRKQPLDFQLKIQNEAAKKIAKMAKESKTPLLVDTHSAINTPMGYKPGMPEWIIKSVAPSVIVLVESSAEHIIGRRAKDSSRKRDNETAEQIELHQTMSRIFASVCSVITGAPVKIIVNADDKLDKAVSEMAKVVGALAK